VTQIRTVFYINNLRAIISVILGFAGMTERRFDVLTSAPTTLILIKSNESLGIPKRYISRISIYISVFDIALECRDGYGAKRRTCRRDV